MKEDKREINGIKNKTIENKTIEFETIDNIPIAFCRPDEHKSNNSIAIWLPYLGGNRETGIRELQKLASHGYFSISIDPWLHGERKGKQKKGVRNLVSNEFRVYMWQIIGITTIDVYRVIDWAINTFDLNENVVIGGLSMGGDIAISLAGIDTRITRVGVIAASPNWNRPGMTDVMDATKLIEQGNSTALGKWLYEKLNPMSNIKSFCRPLQIHIELGASDTHIHPDWTIEFKKELCKNYSDAEHNIEVVINEGCNHLSLIQRKSIIDKAIDFMIDRKKE
jgi:uncharacterized protein